MKKVLIGILGIIAMLGAGCGVLFFVKQNEYKEFQESNTYLEGTQFQIGEYTIDGSNKTAQEIYDEYIQNAPNAQVVTVMMNNQTFEIPLDNYCNHQLQVQDIEKYIDDTTFMDFVTKKANTYELKDNYVYNGGAEQEVEQIITNHQYEYTKSVDAYFDKENIKVIPEVYGNEIIPQKATELFKEELNQGNFNIVIDSEDLYTKPEILENDIKEKYKNVLDLLEWTADYSVSDYVIKMSDYKDSITINDDGIYEVNYDFLKNAVLGLSKTIDNTYDEVKFHTSNDKDITIKKGSKGTYGQIMSNAKEIDYLKEKISKREKVTNREPEWICVPIEDGENPKTYVEVDLKSQHVWHYEDGELCCESDCVTGDAAKKRETPTGVFYVSEMVKGKYLIGDDYKTWVDRWMRLTNSGIGLHDASWRGSFGGNIYKTNGSHGCINLPHKYAKKLYDEIYYGIPVFVYK